MSAQLKACDVPHSGALTRRVVQRLTGAIRRDRVRSAPRKLIQVARQPSWLARVWAHARLAWCSRSVRREDEVFADLQRLSRSPGYICALSAICSRNDWVTATGKLQPGDFSRHYAPQHFTRTEFSPLLGTVVQGPID